MNLVLRLDVELAWIKAHVNYKGNELADRLAKTGTKLANKAQIEPGRATINSQISKHMYLKGKLFDINSDRWQFYSSELDQFTAKEKLGRGERNKMV